MVPTDAAVQCQFTSLLVVHVHTDHLRSSQSLTTHAETAATAAKAHVVNVVCTGHHHHSHILLHQAIERTTRISATCTDTNIIVSHEASVHTWLNTEVKHSLLFAVLNTTDTGQITLLVVGLDTVDNVRRQVLHGRLRITSHKLLTINEDFLHFLTIDLDTTVVADLSTRKSLNQFLDHRTFWGTEGSSVVDEGVCLQRYLSCMSCNGSTLQHDSIGLQGNGAQLHILIGLCADTLGVSLEAHTRHLYDISSCTWSLYTKTTVKFGQHTCCQSTVSLQQFYRGLSDRLL